MPRHISVQTQAEAAPPVRPGLLQRKCACGQHTTSGGECEECGKKRNLQRRRDESAEPSEAPHIVFDALRSPARPLDAPTRRFMEPQFGHDFSRVRIHSDALAAASAKAVGAVAYTVGSDVVFNSGQYAPETPDGRALLAHELTHVVQQQAGAARAATLQALEIAPTSSPAEAEADRFARQAALGDAPHRSIQAHGPAVQRKEPTETPKEREQITLPSGLRVDKELFVKMLVMCDQGKLDPLRCVEMRKMIGPQPGPSPFGSPSLSLGGTPEKLPSPIETRKMMEDLNRSLGLGKPLLPSASPTLPPAQLPAAPAGPSSPISDMLSFKFKGGPVEFSVDLPKSVAAKLPVALSLAKSLAFELKAETSGTFSFTVSLEGLPHVRVSAKAGLTVDKDKGTSGSVGIEIESQRKVCSAANPEILKQKITAAGQKLKTAYDELPKVQEMERISKLTDIAGAIGEMYGAIEESKTACKPAPFVTFGFGLQGPLSPTDTALNDPDPLKRPSIFIGPSLKLNF